MGMCAVCLRLLAVILMLIGEWSGGLGLAAEAALHGDLPRRRSWARCRTRCARSSRG